MTETTDIEKIADLFWPEICLAVAREDGAKGYRELLKALQEAYNIDAKDQQLNRYKIALEAIANYNYHGQQSMPDIAREALDE